MLHPLKPYQTIHFWKGNFLKIMNIAKFGIRKHRRENAGRLKTIFWCFSTFFLPYFAPQSFPLFDYEREFYVDMF